MIIRDTAGSPVTVRTADGHTVWGGGGKPPDPEQEWPPTLAAPPGFTVPGTSWEVLHTPGSDPLVTTARTIDLNQEVRLAVNGSSSMTGSYSENGPFSTEVTSQPGMSNLVDEHITHAMSGRGLQTFVNTSDMRAFYAEGATNIATIYATRNTVVLARRNNDAPPTVEGLAAYTVEMMRQYTENLRAGGQDWVIVVLANLPTGGSPGNQDYLLESDAINVADSTIAQNLGAVGADAFVRWSNWAPFNHTGKERAPFDAYLDHWQEQSPRFTHAKGLGLTRMALNVADAIQRLGGMQGYEDDVMGIVR